MITLSLAKYIVDQFDSRYAAVRTIVNAAAKGEQIGIRTFEIGPETGRLIKKIRCQAYIPDEVEYAYRERARSLGIGLSELAMRTLYAIGDVPLPVHRWPDIPEDTSMLLKDEEPDYEPTSYEECLEILKRKGMA